MYCTNCGHRNPEGSNFCSSCGHALADASGTDTTVTFTPAELETEIEEEVHISPDELEGGRAVLIVKRGPNAGSKFFLDTDSTTIGRHPDSDIFLDDITVSRRHAVIRHDRDGYEVSDAGSLNGTYVNHERVETSPLRHLDELQVGRFVLLFMLGGLEEHA